jgi:acylphosphatase
MKQSHVKLHGDVQGVGCRFFVSSAAREEGLVGFVKNLPDGSVEVYAEGSQKAVDSFLEKIRRGPPAGRVERVQELDDHPRGSFDRFTIEF